MVARPTAVSADLAARIDAARAPSFAALLAELGPDALTVSPRTLRRYCAKSGKRFGVAGPSTAPLERAATAAVEAGEAGGLEHVQADIEAALATWREYLGSSDRAVRAYAALSRALADVVEKIAALRPPAPLNPDDDPANVAAKKRLLAMVDEALARCP